MVTKKLQTKHLNFALLFRRKTKDLICMFLLKSHNKFNSQVYYVINIIYFLFIYF